jgi:HSP20 family molecular chaperone IbpA
MARDWAYCPYCGGKINNNSLFSGLSKMINGLFNNNELFNTNNAPEAKVFKFRISTGPEGKLVVSNNLNQNQVLPSKKSVRMTRMPSELIEPKTIVNKSEQAIELIIELPGIKSLNDINLIRMGESLEVRAVKGNKGYFKLIKVPGDYAITNKSIDKEVLSVRLNAK